MKKGIYKHYKGNLYELLGEANHSETLEKMVVYKALYGDGELWVRPKSMWDEKVFINGKNVPRFEYAGDSVNIEKSCGAVCWRLNGEKIEYLILFQKGSKTWSFPKGHMEKGETKIETAKREIYEEIGINAKIDDGFSRTLSYTLKNGNVKYVYLFLTKVIDDIKLAENEAGEYRWLNLNEAALLLPDVGYGELLKNAEEYIKERLL